MYIAMNRFRIHAGRESDFEATWAERETYLDQVPGFEQFRLLRGPSADGLTLYVSHSVWKSEDAFRDWTRSEAFRRAHAQAGATRGVLEGHPEFEGVEVVL